VPREGPQLSGEVQTGTIETRIPGRMALGVDGERRSLEDVAKPLTAEEAETESTA
jgi:hypothetical protein